MKARINRTLLEQTRFDSGALSPTDFVVHPYMETGHYQAEVSRNGQYQYSFRFEVTADSKEMQISIDLANLQKPPTSTRKECDCSHDEKGMQLAPGGYGLFYTATGSGGYSVRTFPLNATDKDRHLVFDSTALQTDDLFGITLLRPGHYVMRDAQQDLQCRLRVDPVMPDKKAYVPAAALHLDDGDLRKNQDCFTLMQAQGLVYRCHPDAHILIELEKPIDVEFTDTPKAVRSKKAPRRVKPARRKPVASWKKSGVQR